MIKLIRQCSAGLLLNLLFNPVLFAVEYKVVVRAHHGIDHAIKEWQPTLNVLTKHLPPHKFVLKPVVSLNEISAAAARAEFDFFLTNPSSFVELELLHGAKALATLNNKRANTAQDSFGSVIFTHVRNEDILTLKDLKNKTLMVVSEPAFGGWRVAWLEMLEQGFNPVTQLKKLMVTKSKTQPEVVQAVLDGVAEAGVVRTDLLERMEAAGKIDMRYLRILNNKGDKTFPFFLSTKLYPEWAFASMKTVSPKLANEVKKILLAISVDSASAKAGSYIGWTTPRDYSPVRKLMQKLKVGPYAK